MKTVRLATTLLLMTALPGFAVTGALADSLIVTGVSNTQINANALVDSLLGAGITRVGNATLIGGKGQQGTFTSVGNVIGFDSGIILGTGLAGNVVGPNNSPSKGFDWQAAGNPKLGDSGHDANSLTFNFTVDPGVTKAAFQYVFGSEEYNEYVGSNYNDSFGFFVNGTNIALIPGTTDPVAINSVNLNSNSAYYVNNISGARNTQLDGLTTVLIADATPHLHPGVNTIMLSIQDRFDGKYDSDVFLKGASFTQGAGAAPEPGAVAMLVGMLVSAGACFYRRRNK